MTKKQILIKDNKEAVIAAINAYLDKIYNSYETFFSEDGKLKEGLTPDEKVESFVKDLKNNQAPIYESVRRKIIDDDFNLSGREIAYVNSTLIYIYSYWEEQIKFLTKAKEEISELIKNMRVKDT